MEGACVIAGLEISHLPTAFSLLVRFANEDRWSCYSYSAVRRATTDTAGECSACAGLYQACVCQSLLSLTPPGLPEGRAVLPWGRTRNCGFSHL
jgi:hypothetical protein